MPTLMSKETYASLCAVKRQMTLGEMRPAPVFVPWAGAGLAAGRGGIYYVGIATRGELDSRDEDSFKASREWTADQVKSSDGWNWPFWKFLNRLSTELLGMEAKQAADHWGWSNLLKIGDIEKMVPAKQAIDKQRDACLQALKEEFHKLHNALIFIASGREFEVLYKSLSSEDHWDKTYCPRAKVWHLWDNQSRNLYAHGYHPAYAQRSGIFNEMVDCTARLAREHFAWVREPA